jgi:hypothetical protein
MKEWDEPKNKGTEQFGCRMFSPFYTLGSLNTFTYLVLNYKNKNADAPRMTTFGERVKRAWKNIYPLQKVVEEQKKKKT